MEKTESISLLFEIASLLNEESGLHSALRRTLEKTCLLMNIEAGWIWLTEQDNKTVYLAASHNLPPALRDFPERLSGWCYCIKKYLEDDINQAVNVSEILCSRLENLSRGTKDLKFHASIPIIIDNDKVGLMNLVSKESRQLEKGELQILNSISLLLGTVIRRIRMQEYETTSKKGGYPKIHSILERTILPKIDQIIEKLETKKASELNVEELLTIGLELRSEVGQISSEMKDTELGGSQNFEFKYPNSPLTSREIEVLHLVKKGLSNKSIGSEIFVSERTVKFHITSILSKLDANNRTEAVNIAVKRGLISR